MSIFEQSPIINGVRHFLADDHVTHQEQADILKLALEMKKHPWDLKPLSGPQSVAVLLDKTSTRTRFSFDVGISQLGGRAIVVDASVTQIGKGESYADTAATLSRMVSAIVWRTSAHKNLWDMASRSTVPVINGLCDDFHPCQIIADLLTIMEKLCPDPRSLGQLRACYIGDGANNMAHSYMLGFATAGLNLTVISPENHQPSKIYVDRARTRAEMTGADISITSDLESAVGADIVITDTWVSMGMEEQAEQRRVDFMPYQVTPQIMQKANKNAIFMHCLPAYRGYEVAADVIDGPQSVVFDQAENRLHAQKALLTWLLAANSDT
ncbi:ornithine carbamoyltransferase [Corynebacterium sp. ES2715-CONJ3]|uniref:ornithine carbamoyltransferase n=1 Tax=Corynebacterium sp. ES2715-CONJ3 TaxID=2974028 RepID=UPI002169F27F|nr:ornithine carbamoyltransferase [Corynebacterium sp. ES2715-CONJ3]MCS4492558.1 ornithine carbamoyltransferase [Corynebacterium sp. ES2715-CONJ3]